VSSITIGIARKLRASSSFSSLGKQRIQHMRKQRIQQRAQAAAAAAQAGAS